MPIEGLRYQSSAIAALQDKAVHLLVRELESKYGRLFEPRPTVCRPYGIFIVKSSDPDRSLHSPELAAVSRYLTFHRCPIPIRSIVAESAGRVKVRLIRENTLCDTRSNDASADEMVGLRGRLLSYWFAVG
jgi:hypothetical protein